MPDPIVTPLSDTSLYIQWIEPAKDQINGQITSYTLYMIMDTDLEANPFDPPTYARVNVCDNSDDKKIKYSSEHANYSRLLLSIAIKL